LRTLRHVLRLARLGSAHHQSVRRVLPQLMRRCGVDVYKRGVEEWRAHAQAAAKTLESYADLFGGRCAAWWRCLF
jgi:hypothetical protein